MQLHPSTSAPRVSSRHEHVRVEVDPPVARLVLDRDPKRNAVSQPMLAAMTAALADLDADDAVRALVLCSEGRDFCAGEDVGGFAFPGLGEAQRFLEGPFGFFTALERLAMPVVVAVQGHALGFGSEVLLVADTVVAQPDATFGFAEIDHGAVPSVLMTRGLDIARRRRALRFALTGERFGADEAVAAGLVHLVADDARATAMELAREQAGWSPDAVGVIKALLGRDAVADHDRARAFMPPVLVQVEVSL